MIAWIQYASTAFFQAVALPLLGYVSKQAGVRQEKLMQETHDMVMQELNAIRHHAKLEGEERKIIVKILKAVEDRLI